MNTNHSTLLVICKLIISLFSAYLLFGCKNLNDEPDFQLRITDESINIYDKRDRFDSCFNTCVDIHYSFTNKFRTNILLYNVRRYMNFGYETPQFDCDSTEAEAWNEVYVFDKDLTIRRPSFSIHDSTTVNIASMMRYVKMKYTWFRNSRIVVKSGETVNLSNRIDFRDFELEAGVYTLQMFYFQDYEPMDEKMLDVEKDLMESNASLFKGCLWSNPVKLVVRHKQ